MSDDEMDEPGVLGFTISDLETVRDEILADERFSEWQTGSVLSFGDLRWAPHAVSPDESKALYVTLQRSVPRFVVSRIARASDYGVRVIVGLTIAALFNEEVVEQLATFDVQVVVIDDPRSDRRLRPRHVLAAVADTEAPVSPDARKKIAAGVWSRIGQGTASEKGRRLEALLAFLFAQVNDLRVVERNYRGTTDEIDLVLQIDNHSSRAWQGPGVPFILVEAKNRTEKSGQPDVSNLITKIQSKRGAAKFGVLVSTADFTQDAQLQELKFSTAGNVCVPMLDGAQLQSLIDADNLDDALEAIVRAALLR